MKRLVLSLVCLVAAPLASASPELAQAWSAKAGELYLQTTAQMVTVNRTGVAPLPESYVIDLERFAVTAARLGAWNDSDGGAKDLGCIFRGIAEDVDVQLSAMETAATPRQSVAALKRLSTLLDDAQQIGTAAAWAAQHGHTSTNAPASCPANPMLRIID